MTVKRPVETLVHPDLSDATILTRIADRLRERLGATRVIVYGSVARGEATIHSDIDLLVVAPTAAPAYRRLEEAREVVADLRVGLPISPIVLTPAEVAARLARGDPFVREIIDTGVEL